ncbi:hypothetical protein NCC78_15925 [Micromonospora phytophila]|uniref:hypothetical protein n=1 Tax=Micromonospora phytophila TaxID=709888 RepID=UPI00202F0927|nr:hypothetical protein [Micromonospora phytophila]MCM0676166.1 hypothetical protein [Micromonospora phytophila]
MLRELVKRCDLPAGATVVRDWLTSLEYRDSGLKRQLSVYPGNPGRLHWRVDVGDAELREPGPPAFWTRYYITDKLVGGQRGVLSRNFTGHPWPVAGGDLSDSLVQDVARFAPQMLWFLRDRYDLGLMLLNGKAEKEGVEGDRWAGPTAGLVQSVILARTAPFPELEALAMTRLDRHRNDEVLGFVGTFSQSVGHWASQYSTSTVVDISDLCALNRKNGTSKR